MDQVVAEGVARGQSPALPRVFVIGFNKCGTTSLHTLFRRAGHRCLHYKLKTPAGPLNLAEMIFANREAGRPLLTGLEEAQVLSDMEMNGRTRRLEAFTLFREFDSQYPGSRFILNLRDKDRWLRSRLHQGDGRYASKQLATRGLSSPDDLVAAWSREWDEHLAAVRDYFADKPDQLVEFDIEADDPAKLVDALPGFGLKAEDWGRRNANPRLAGQDAGPEGRARRRRRATA